MKRPTAALTAALEETGALSWWDERLPSVLQLEFVGSELATRDAGEGFTPVSQVALRFRTPTLVGFLRRAEATLPDNWYEVLRADELEPLALSAERVVFDDKAAAKALLEEAASIDWLVRPADIVESLGSSPSVCAFWAGSVGVVVGAPEVTLISASGNLEPESIPELHDNWWKYWKRYWAVRSTLEALPYDATCEVVLPLAKH